MDSKRICFNVSYRTLGKRKPIITNYLHSPQIANETGFWIVFTQIFLGAPAF